MLGAFASGVGGLTPWGAAAGAIGGIASTPTSSSASTGDVHIAGLDFGPSQNSQFAQYALIGVALVVVGVVATRGRR